MTKLAGMTTKELQALMQSRGGRGTWTPEERAELFGDEELRNGSDYDAVLMARFCDGHALSKADRKRARKLLKA